MKQISKYLYCLLGIFFSVGGSLVCVQKERFVPRYIDNACIGNRIANISKKIGDKIKKYFCDKKVQRAALAVVFTGGAFMVGKYCRIRCCFHKSIHTLQRDLESNNNIQIRVPLQKGYTCGYHAVVNSALIANAILEGVNGAKSQGGVQSYDPLFLSRFQLEYKKGNKGKWREKIERERKKQDGKASQETIEDDCLNAGEVDLLGSHLNESDLNIRYYNAALVYTPNVGLDCGRMKGEIALRDTINQFKHDASKTILPLIVHVNGNHWVADVLYKKEDDSIVHIIADSFNIDRLQSPEIIQLITMTRKI